MKSVGIMIRRRNRTNKTLSQQKTLIIKGLQGLNVVPPGIEPGTQGFSVLCSTN